MGNLLKLKVFMNFGDWAFYMNNKAEIDKMIDMETNDFGKHIPINIFGLRRVYKPIMIDGGNVDPNGFFIKL